MDKRVEWQQTRGESINTPRLLHPLAIPSQQWEEVSMDFITGLPKYEGKSVIMVFVGRIKKYVNFFSISHPFKTSTMVEAIMEIVQKLRNTKYYCK